MKKKLENKKKRVLVVKKIKHHHYVLAGPSFPLPLKITPSAERPSPCPLRRKKQTLETWFPGGILQLQSFNYDPGI